MFPKELGGDTGFGFANSDLLEPSGLLRRITERLEEIVMTQQAQPRFDAIPGIGESRDLLDEALARVARSEMALAACGGTLHDVNNLLTVLSGNLYLLTESLRQDTAMLPRCRSARDTAQRAATLIRELLTFTRSADPSESCICPATFVENLENVLRRSIGSQNTLSVRASPNAWRVTVSVAQLESAIANLVLNAKHALTTDGRIEIEVANVPAGSRTPAQLLGKDYIRISVRDNGAGIPADRLPRVTQPMYTSKPKGQGSGMGLTMVCRFAQSAGGQVTIKSTEGRGTEVSIWLPRDSESTMTTSLTMPISTLPSGDEAILVAVRDDNTATTIQQLLEALGYRVSTAGDRVDVVAAMESDPEIALIIGTVDLLDHVAGHAARHSIDNLLALLHPDDDTTKINARSLYLPVSIPELAHSVRQLLDGD